jgi:hypothetical protein
MGYCWAIAGQRVKKLKKKNIPALRIAQAHDTFLLTKPIKLRNARKRWRDIPTAVPSHISA